MRHIFNNTCPIRVPNGTLVSPFLNSKDCTSGLPLKFIDDFSLSAGTIEAGTESKIHVMPFVTQVTFVRKGKLDVRMKGAEDETLYYLRVGPEQSIITRPGTLLQLINRGDNSCKVLYIVSPPYIYEMLKGKVIYDDSVVLDESWEDLRESGWKPARKMPTIEERQRAIKRLAERDFQS